MAISTLSRYGLRAMLEIANGSNSNPMSSRQISRQEKIPTPYLEQILSRLKHSGLVRSIRGAQGGYMLGQSARQITVGDIVTALDGPQSFADCKRGKCQHECGTASPCKATIFWKKLDKKLNDEIYSTTLQDIIDDWQEQVR